MSVLTKQQSSSVATAIASGSKCVWFKSGTYFLKVSVIVFRYTSQSQGEQSNP